MYFSTLAMSEASCAREASSQNVVGSPVARARATARRTQSLIGASLVWHIRQTSPCWTACSKYGAPEELSTTRIVPAAAHSKVLSCEPYSSAFCAIRPTLATLPIVVTSNWPLSLQSSMIAEYIVA